MKDALNVKEEVDMGPVVEPQVCLLMCCVLGRIIISLDCLDVFVDHITGFRGCNYQQCVNKVDISLHVATMMYNYITCMTTCDF